jgi:hypothetical protein
MQNRWMKFLLGSVALLLCVSLAFSAEDGTSKGVKKTTTNDYYNWFTINNIFNWYGNNGDGSVNNSNGQSGFEFPKGSGNTAIFEDGIIWGGFHKGRSDPKVGGSAYNQMLQAGVLTGYGTATTDPTADDPTLAKYRVYKVRPDVTPTTPFASVQKAMEDEAALINRYSTMTAQTLFNQYVKDWNEWPSNEGTAPYNDVNKNGRYDAATDIPGQPGADQTLYYVANDANATRTTGGYSSPPIGLEMHRTFWGYNLVGALGNTIFCSTLIINKSGAPVDSMFLVQWSDPDLGEAGDDYVGCDVARSLGFVYNGQTFDATYGVAVPSSGYTFFQGPIFATGNPADSAVFRLKYRKGYINLKMSAFTFFTQGNATFRDPIRGGDPAGDNEWYRLMNGRIAATDGPFINPKTGEAQKFVLDGDPLSGKGWLDGTSGLVPGDRRMALVTGPITLADRDTQELVVATLVGLGADRLSSVAVIRYYSDLGQSAYNSLFNVPRPPPSPKVAVSQLDGEISMSWADSVGSTKIEAFNSAGYAFEGYNVYQFNGATPDFASAKKLATYDLVNAVTTIFDDVYDPATGYIISKPVQFGTDGGIKRTYITTQDAIGQKTLVNGTTYYFGVTSYGFNGSPTARPTQLESTPDVLAVIPQWDPPGSRYAAATGDTLPVVHAGPSDGNVFPTVVNPNLMKKEGATYKIAFQGAAGSGTWNLVRTWNGKIDTVARNITNQTADDLSPIIDGIQWRVIGAPLDFKYFLTVANKNGAITPFQHGAFSFNGSGFPLPPSGLDRPNGTIQQSAGLGVSQGWGIHTGMNSATMSLSYTNFVSRVTQAGARWPLLIPYDFEIRFTAAGGKALIPDAFTGTGNYLIDVPFELWNVGISTPTNAADDYRLFPNILDIMNDHTFNLTTKPGTDTVDNGGGGPTHSISGGNNDPFTDWIYWALPKDKSPGQAGYNAIVAQVTADIAAGSDPWLSAASTDGLEVLRRMVIVGWNMGAVATGPGSYSLRMPEVGTTLRIVTTKPNSTADSFTITAAPADQSSTLAQADADRVNVYPNPYIGFNPAEVNKYERFVTFTHLPNTATLRIFNLAGVPVRTLQKSDASQFFTWDLRNESGFPVGAGMYIVYIDMPEVGKTKTLKLGIIPEQQYLDKW